MNQQEPYLFFIVTPPALEKMALLEMEQKWPLVQLLRNSYFSTNDNEETLPPYQILKGGVEIELPLITGLLLNVVLKTPTRILLRLSQFKCRDFPKLYQKLRKFSWNFFLSGAELKINSSSHESRIFDSRKITKTVLDAIKNYQQGHPLKKIHIAKDSLNPRLPTNIYLRFQDDLCDLSIDTSGNPLYKRNIKIHVGLAPIRENLAASLLTFLCQEKNFSSHDNVLIDPMCGSGTFLLEALTFHQCQIHRDFQFSSFPFFYPYLAKFEKLKRLSHSSVENLSQMKFSRYIGLEKNPKILEQTKLNLEKIDCDNNVQLYCDDIFSELKIFIEKNKWIILNPPYGKRISVEGESYEKYLEKVIHALNKKFQPHFLGIIIPDTTKLKEISWPSNMSLKRKLSFENGGIKAHFFVYQFSLK